MAINNWIIDNAVPITLENNSASVDFSFLRRMIVVLKGTDDLVIKTISQPTAIAELLPLNGALDGGLISVDYITKADLDLSTLSLKGSYYTVVAVGFTDVEVNVKNLGTYDGVFIYNLASGVGTNELNIGWVRDTSGYTSIYTYALLLSAPEWKTIAYKSTNKNVEVIEDPALGNPIYDARGTYWGKDDQVGKRVMSMFINGKSAVKPYIYREIALKFQEAFFNGLTTQLKYTQGQATLLNKKGEILIDELYGDILTSYVLDIRLNPTDNLSFNTSLTIEVPETIWKNYVIVEGK